MRSMQGFTKERLVRVRSLRRSAPPCGRLAVARAGLVRLASLATVLFIRIHLEVQMSTPVDREISINMILAVARADFGVTKTTGHPPRGSPDQ